MAQLLNGKSKKKLKKRSSWTIWKSDETDELEEEDIYATSPRKAAVYDPLKAPLLRAFLESARDVQPLMGSYWGAGSSNRTRVWQLTLCMFVIGLTQTWLMTRLTTARSTLDTRLSGSRRESNG